MTDQPVSKELGVLGEVAESIGGTIEEVGILPDNSGFAVISSPLPADHWLTQEGYNDPPMPFQMGTEHQDRQEWAEKIRLAAKYAIRATSANGKIDDTDPDAMVNNFVIGMLGYYTPDGLSSTSDLTAAEK